VLLVEIIVPPDESKAVNNKSPRSAQLAHSRMFTGGRVRSFPVKNKNKIKRKSSKV